MNGYDETKYISCKGCGCEIEADQRKYPYCKTINLSAPKKNSNKLLVIVPTALLVIAAVVVFLITSHAGGNDNIHCSQRFWNKIYRNQSRTHN